MSPDRLRHGAGITQPLAVDGPNHEKVDCVGAKTFDGELGGFDVVRHGLPAVAHGLTGIKEPAPQKKRIRTTNEPIKPR